MSLNQNNHIENKENKIDIKGRGTVDHMLRTVQANLVSYSSMADHKAHIIIAATSVVFTLSVRFANNPKFFFGFISLGIFSLLSLIYAILSVTPIFDKNKEDKILNKDLNLLFFGHISSMKYEEYYERMKDILSDDEKIYETVIKDIYQNSFILSKKKYNYLNRSYRILFFGLLLSAFLFILEFFIR